MCHLMFVCLFFVVEPDESTDQADSPPEPTVRRRSSVRDKVSLLDRNSNEKQPIESKQKSSTLPSGDQPTDTGG